ncbi:MAG TPA: ParB/RepB/Spo0J family partition protein [Thermoleophilia bacterium]|nr:ParB/RepB/Spo0J family partition protein [Thermoleophilia bacterium]
MARRSGLGRGLGALIPTEVVNDRASDLAEIPVSAIEPNPAQPRSHFDEEMLASLAASIREVGVLQPILVRPIEGGRYQLVAGERRWRAAKRVGLQTVPALIRTMPDESSLEHALVENLHRQDLNPLEEAAAYQQLIEGFGLTHDEVAARVGRSRAAVSNTLRLFQLPPAIQRMVMDGALSAGHARALLGTPDRAFQEALARRAVSEQLSVRAVEDAVRERNELAGASGPLPQVAAHRAGTPLPRPRGTAAEDSAAVHALEEMLSEFLDTRVKIDLGNRKSRLTVEFADLDDLERIYRRMISS